MSGGVTLRELQTNLPWGIRYSRDFRANPQSHKDFAHALLHVLKAAGKLSIVVDSIDHDHELAADPGLRDGNARFLADLVYCALRMANTFPGGVVDLERALLDRIQEKHGKPAIKGESPQLVVADDALKAALDAGHFLPEFPPGVDELEPPVGPMVGFRRSGA